jgi:hypothetical protein
MTRSQAEPETEPVFHESHVSIGHGPGRTPERLVIVGLVLLVLLVIKPWGPTPEPATAPRPVASVAPTEKPLSYAETPCAAGMWLVEADTRWAGQIVRSWIMTDAVEATGPSDPAIRFVVVAAQQVLAIGYCPSYYDDTRPHDRLTIYRVDPSVSTVIITPVQVPREADAAHNELFAPMATPGPSGQAPSVVGWASGRYVIRIDGPDGYRRWLGVEVRLISPGMPSPATSPAP